MRYVAILLVLVGALAQAQIIGRPSFYTAPTAGLLPFTDAFAGDALGARWTAGTLATWAVGSGVASNTPAYGAELLTDPGMETWADSVTPPAEWTKTIGGTSTVSKSVIMRGGSYSAALWVDASNTGIDITRSAITNRLLYFSVYARNSASSKTWKLEDASQSPPTTNVTPSVGSFTLYRSTFAFHNNYLPMFRRVSAASDTCYVDDVSCKQIWTAGVMALAEAGQSNIDVSVEVTGVASTSLQGGVIVSYTDTLNYIRAFVTSGTANTNMSCVLVKMVAGTATRVIYGAPTYVAGAVVRVVKSGDDLSLYYNGTQVGITTAATGFTGTKHGIFSLDPSVTLDDFSMAAP